MGERHTAGASPDKGRSTAEFPQSGARPSFENEGMHARVDPCGQEARQDRLTRDSGQTCDGAISRPQRMWGRGGASMLTCQGRHFGGAPIFGRERISGVRVDVADHRHVPQRDGSMYRRPRRVASGSLSGGGLRRWESRHRGRRPCGSRERDHSRCLPMTLHLADDPLAEAKHSAVDQPVMCLRSNASSRSPQSLRSPPHSHLRRRAGPRRLLQT